MRALLATVMMTEAAGADMVSRCSYAYPLVGEECKAFEGTAFRLLHFLWPEGLRITDLKQSANTFVLYVEPTGPVTGKEGESMTKTLCSLPDLRMFLDRNYQMSVRMSYEDGGMKVLDEIAFIEDCEAP
jgi:hypothetical protein